MSWGDVPLENVLVEGVNIMKISYKYDTWRAKISWIPEKGGKPDNGAHFKGWTFWAVFSNYQRSEKLEFFHENILLLNQNFEILEK